MSTMDEGKRRKRPRRSFTDDFKAGAVRLVLDEGKARMVVLNADSRAPPHGRTNSRTHRGRKGCTRPTSSGMHWVP